MNVTYWIALLFGISLAMWLLGMQSGAGDIMAKYSAGQYFAADGASLDVVKMIGDVLSHMLNWNNAIFFLAFAGGALVGGLNLLVLLPLGALILIMNFAIFPTSYIQGSGLPLEVSAPLMAFFTITELMIVFSLMRGSAR